MSPSTAVGLGHTEGLACSPVGRGRRAGTRKRHTQRWVQGRRANACRHHTRLRSHARLADCDRKQTSLTCTPGRPRCTATPGATLATTSTAETTNDTHAARINSSDDFDRRDDQRHPCRTPDHHVVPPDGEHIHHRHPSQAQDAHIPHTAVEI